MSSIQLVDGRDVARDRALLKATKQRVKDEIAKRTAARVGKYLACPSNTVVDLTLIRILGNCTLGQAP